jgi:hypothetical protein
MHSCGDFQKVPSCHICSPGRVFETPSARYHLAPRLIAMQGNEMLLAEWPSKGTSALQVIGSS